ncbi:MAG: AsmA family protein, partial [candidate division Zixibacteria bacterium]|nr:AsmA family protein [candidate division Zixibacteria bacterium]
MTRRRITVYVSLGAVVLIIAAAYLYVFQFGGLERIVRGRIAAALGPDSVVKVSVGDISGSLLSGVRVESIVIAYEDSLGTHTVAVARAVSADYSIRNLWEKRFIFGNVTIDSLALRASRDSNGRWVIPLPLAGAGGGGEPPLFAVRQLSLSDASVTIVMPDDTVRVTDLKLLASVRGEDGTYSLQIERMGYTVDPAIYALSSVTGRVTLAQKNLVFQDCQVQRGDTRLKVSGSLNFENREGAAEFTSDNLDLLRIADFGGPRLEGLLDLGGRVILRNGALFGQITVAGNIKQARFDNVYAQFEYADKMFTVDTLYGMVFGDCSIDGNGYIDFSASPQEYHLGANIRNFNLKSLVTQSFRSDLSGTVILDGRSFRSADLWMKIQSDLFESSFDEYPLHRAAGTMEVTAESIRFYDGFQVDYFENEFVAGGELVYRGDINLAVDV